MPGKPRAHFDQEEFNAELKHKMEQAAQKLPQDETCTYIDAVETVMSALNSLMALAKQKRTLSIDDVRLAKEVMFDSLGVEEYTSYRRREK